VVIDFWLAYLDKVGGEIRSDRAFP
jgi:hypothetical protein